MKKERPTLITFFCILGFIGVPLTFIVSLFDFMSPLGLIPEGTVIPLWYLIFTLVWAVFYFIALIFIWKMKKIGLISYTGLALIEYSIGFASGLATIDAFIISLIVITVLWTQFKKLS